MKKTYIQPQMFVSEFELEGLIAVSSITITDEERVKTSQGEQLTNKHNGPWSATNWE